MVSARSVADARVALAAGVELIDVKEPRNGPLGMADESELEDISRAVDGAAPLGASLGEWLDRGGSESAPEVVRTPETVRYLKVGLAGLAHAAGWRDAYRDWRERVSASRADATPVWVAVIYADWRRCGAPSPEDVLELSGDGFGALLVDTFSKTRASNSSDDLGGLFDHLGDDELGCIVTAARDRGLEIVLSGSLTVPGARRAAELGADVVGLRTAVCRDGRRDGELDAERIAAALAAVRGASGATE